jgi:hypothetical protein
MVMRTSQDSGRTFLGVWEVRPPPALRLSGSAHSAAVSHRYIIRKKTREKNNYNMVCQRQPGIVVCLSITDNTESEKALPIQPNAS